MPTENDSPEAAARAVETPEADDSGVSTEGHGSETAEERESRIAKLRERIAQGTYKPDARKLAARLVDAHLGRKS
jgi:anti-sigma28 factor (negative regulator of flagellin synthesis)